MLGLFYSLVIGQENNDGHFIYYNIAVDLQKVQLRVMNITHMTICIKC